jgi:hypothetical protein
VEGIYSGEVEVATTVRHLDITGNNMIWVLYASAFMAPLHINLLFYIHILREILWQSLIVNCIHILVTSKLTDLNTFMIVTLST